MTDLTKKERSKVRNRMSDITDEIEDTLDYKNLAADSELDHKMAEAKLAGLNAEYAKLERLLEFQTKKSLCKCCGSITSNVTTQICDKCRKANCNGNGGCKRKGL